MNSAEALTADDRCKRFAFLAKSWQKLTMNPTAVLYKAIEDGLTYEGTDDCGTHAGDTVMTLAVERGLNTEQSDLYGLANHLAAMADLITWMLRPQGPWVRPANTKVGQMPWESSVFLNDSGTRLKRVVLVDHWSKDRELSAAHSWYAAGETSAYQMPMDQTVLIIGQNRQGRRHGPFSKGWTHPVSNLLRMRKRDGKGFDGNWKSVFREDTDFSREHWLDVMTQDGVLQDAVFQVEVPVHEEAAKIRRLEERKLAAIRECAVLPEPQPSQCDGISPCAYIDACWSFKAPCEKLGFFRILG